MEKKRLIVVGAVAAGTKAASKAKRENQDWEVIVLTKDKDISYAGCGLPYYLSGVIKERKELVVRGPQEFEEEQDILVLTGREVTDINPQEKTVVFTELDSGKVHTAPYDYLVLATGASPFFPPLEGIKLKNIYPLRKVSDADYIRALVENGEVREAIVVGAGFIGLEAAENLAVRGIKVTILEMLPLVLPGYDEEMSVYVKRYLTEQDVDVQTAVRVQGFLDDGIGRVKGVKVGDQVVPAQLVIWAGGVCPNVDLAKKAGVALSPTGAIEVNEYQETNVPYIYAVGDCTGNKNLLTGEACWFPMGSTANKAGRVAGLNIGCEKPRDNMPGLLGTSVVKLFELHAARTGLTEKQALEKGYDAVSVIVPANDIAHYYPGYREIITKLIADKKSGRILGAQIIGEGVVDKPVDIIATLITCGGTLEQLSHLDLAYAPPFSMAIGSTILAAYVLINKIQGKFPGINPFVLRQMLDKDEVTIVDVRTEAEYFIKAIPGSINIPHNEILMRYGEIPRDKKIVVTCKVGKRAYLVLPTLRKLGFQDVMILEGGIAAYPYTLE